VSKSVLIAGIGNIFNGDDSFGVAVAHRLSSWACPEGVRIVDFGIRALDLAFAFLDGYDLTILVDATSQGGAPGTLYIIEPNIDGLAGNHADALVNSHGLDPVKVLALAKSMGAQFQRILLIGCEPLTVGEEEGGIMKLSEVVDASVDRAAGMIKELVDEFERTGEIALYAEAEEGY